jgi:hypothetical protein
MFRMQELDRSEHRYSGDMTIGIFQTMRSSRTPRISYSILTNKQSGSWSRVNRAAFLVLIKQVFHNSQATYKADVFILQSIRQPDITQCLRTIGRNCRQSMRLIRDAIIRNSLRTCCRPCKATQSSITIHGLPKFQTA